MSAPVILSDPEIMSKLDRFMLFVDSMGKDKDYELASNIKIDYVRTGILTKEHMDKLNKMWIRNGGGRW